MMDKKLSVSEQIAAQNAWYVAKQDLQLSTPGVREVVENRWSIIEDVLLLMQKENKFNNKIRVLDAGCGDGNNLVGLQMAADKIGVELEMFAMDYNPLRVKRVKERDLLSSVSCANLLQLPFPDESFDLIVCNHVLEHIPDYMGALNELHRTISKGGLLLLGVPNEGCFLAWLRNHCLQRSILKTTDHVNFFTGHSLSVYTEQVGFSVESVFRFGFFSPHFYLHMLLMKVGIIRKSLFKLGEVMPSQCADLQQLLRKN